MCPCWGGTAGGVFLHFSPPVALNLKTRHGHAAGRSHNVRVDTRGCIHAQMSDVGDVGEAKAKRSSNRRKAASTSTKSKIKSERQREPAFPANRVNYPPPRGAGVEEDDPPPADKIVPVWALMRVSNDYYIPGHSGIHQRFCSETKTLLYCVPDVRN